MLDEESATGDEPSKMLIVPARQWPGAPRLGKIGREIIPDSGRRGLIIDMFLKARDPCAAVKGAEGVWSVFGNRISLVGDCAIGVDLTTGCGRKGGSIDEITHE